MPESTKEKLSHYLAETQQDKKSEIDMEELDFESRLDIQKMLAKLVFSIVRIKLIRLNLIDLGMLLRLPVMS